MPGMRDIKRRIRSVKNTQQITKAMKMVSAAKLRKNQDALIQYRPFSDTHFQMVGRILSRVEAISHPLLQEKPQTSRLIILITGDKGLCGSFNHGIIRLVEENLKKAGSDNVTLYALGKKGRDYFKKRGFTIFKYHPLTIRGDVYEVAQQVGEDVLTGFENGDFDAVDIYYSQFKSALTQKPRFEKLIPLAAVPLEEEYPREYLFEPSPQQVLNALLPLSVKLTIYRRMLETITAEHGARMTAMDSATNNAIEMVASLTLSYNKARQAAITKELIEVVSGADALQ